MTNATRASTQTSQALLLGIFLAALAACQSPVSGLRSATSDASHPGLTVTWQVGDPKARTITPAGYPTPATYDVTLTPASGTPLSQTGVATTTWTFANLANAVYSITVTGKDASGNALVAGSATADLTTGTAPSPNVVLSYFTSGTGTGQIHLTFNASGTGVSSTTLTLVDPAGTIVVNGSALSGTYPTFTYTNASASVGSYKLFARFFNPATNQFVVKLDNVWVVRNLDTAATITVAPSDLVAAYVGVTTLTLSAGSTLTLGHLTTQTLTPTFNAGASNPLLVWSSDQPACASVNQSGVVAAAGIGVAHITASSVDNPGVSATSTVTVVAPLARWANSVLTTVSATSYAFGLATDPAGNVWVTGTEGALPLLYRFNAGGTVTLPVAMSGSAVLQAVATDSSGSVYVAGGALYNAGAGVTFAGTLFVPGYTAGPTAMVAKLDSSGTFQWFQSIASAPSSSYYQAVAVDNTNGLVYAGGRTLGTGLFNFNGGITNTAVNTGGSPPYNNFLVVQFTTTGLPQWARTPTAATNNSWVQGMAADSTGVWAVGFGTGNANFTIAGTTFVGATVGDNYALVKFDTTGVGLWSKSSPAGDTGNSHYNSVAVDASHNAYVGGYATGTAPFGIESGLTVNPVNSNSSAKNILLVKYDVSGTHLWAKTLTAGNGDAEITSVALEPNGNLLVGGYITGTAVYGLGNGVNLTGVGAGTNLFVAEYDTNGNPLWGRVSLSALVSQATGVAAGPAGQIYASGYFTGPGSFDMGNATSFSGAFSGANPALMELQ